MARRHTHDIEPAAASDLPHPHPHGTTAPGHHEGADAGPGAVPAACCTPGEPTPGPLVLAPCCGGASSGGPITDDGASAPTGAGRHVFRIPTMDCSIEESEIRRLVEPLPGIRGLHFTLSRRQLRIDGTDEAVPAALTAIRKAGTVVVTGLGDLTEVGIPISPGELTLYQKRVQGSLFGASSPSRDILAMLDLYQAGKLRLAHWARVAPFVG